MKTRLLLATLLIPFTLAEAKRLSSKDEAKVLAAELRAIHSVCVVPPEMADGTQDVSLAGELAKVLRDDLNWEAEVCRVEYHAGHKLSIQDKDKFDACLELNRRENAWGSSSSWQSRSVTVVLTPLRDLEGQRVEGKWDYTNNMLNPNEMTGIAKKIKKSMGK
jgi:hypothetical protein